MKGNSLRLRLLGGALIAIFVALAIAGAGISWMFHRHVERRETTGLLTVGEQVAAGLSEGPLGVPTVRPMPVNPSYQRIASGSYWQVTGPAGSEQSPSLWDQSLPTVEAVAQKWSTSILPGPFGERLLLISRKIRPNADGTWLLVQVAKDDRAMRGTIREFDLELAASLSLLWIVLALAAYIQVGHGLRPLERVRAELERMRRSPAARLGSDHPREIAPLAEAINALAQAREDDLVRARHRASDLAHSLKTPLAVLHAQSRRAREAGAARAADGLDRAAAAIGASLEAELARARAASTRSLSGTQKADAAAVTDGIIGVLERTASGERIVVSCEIGSGTLVPVSPMDLTEIVGALAENASRHARRQVVISASESDDAMILRIDDDGPGMDDDRAALAMTRGVRLDESGAGHGMGLAIVRDLVQATNGEFQLERSPLGGLAAIVTWRR